MKRAPASDSQMHLAYPWTGELLRVTFVYRNVWLDLTWSWLLSSNWFADVSRQAIDVVPDESRMMLAGIPIASGKPPARLG